MHRSDNVAKDFGTDKGFSDLNGIENVFGENRIPLYNALCPKTKY